MARPKGSKNKPKDGLTNVVVAPKNERIVLRPVNTGQTFINEDGVIYEKNIFYSFKSRIPGTIYYPGDDNTTKRIDGNTIRNDISPRERDFLLKMDAYREGLFVEWNIATPEESSSFNALNDTQMDKLCEKYIKDGNKEALLSHIKNMDSVFALNLLKEKILEKNLPGSVVKYCEGKIEELEEEAAKKMEAPIDSEKK